MRTQLDTVDIKGKQYVTVNTRIKYFRETEAYKGWSLRTEVIELNEKRAVLKAIIEDDKGVIRATGLAYENANTTYINKTSYIENCETSAWGRALGNLGIGIDTSIASSEEVENAISAQETIAAVGKKIQFINSKQITNLETKIASIPNFDASTFVPWFEKAFGVKYTNLAGLTVEQYNTLLDIISSKANK